MWWIQRCLNSVWKWFEKGITIRPSIHIIFSGLRPDDSWESTRNSYGANKNNKLAKCPCVLLLACFAHCLKLWLNTIDIIFLACFFSLGGWLRCQLKKWLRCQFWSQVAKVMYLSYELLLFDISIAQCCTSLVKGCHPDFCHKTR